MQHDGLKNTTGQLESENKLCCPLSYLDSGTPSTTCPRAFEPLKLCISDFDFRPPPVEVRWEGWERPWKTSGSGRSNPVPASPPQPQSGTGQEVSGRGGGGGDWQLEAPMGRDPPNSRPSFHWGRGGAVPTAGPPGGLSRGPGKGRGLRALVEAAAAAEGEAAWDPGVQGELRPGGGGPVRVAENVRS